jgi:hypothetical protein
VRDLAGAFATTSWEEGEAVWEFELAAAATGALFDLVGHVAAATPRQSRAARVTRTRVSLKDDGTGGR